MQTTFTPSSRPGIAHTDERCPKCSTLANDPKFLVLLTFDDKMGTSVIATCTRYCGFFQHRALMPRAAFTLTPKKKRSWAARLAHAFLRGLKVLVVGP